MNYFQKTPNAVVVQCALKSKTSPCVFLNKRTEHPLLPTRCFHNNLSFYLNARKPELSLPVLAEAVSSLTSSMEHREKSEREQKAEGPCS